MINNMVTIYDYLDYREFLRDYYSEKKQKTPFFSYRYISSHVGMDSSFVIKVLQGNLHISTKKIDLFIKLLGLSGTEAEYFETLVHFGKAKTERQRKFFFEKLFSVSAIKAEHLEPHQYEFFLKWYYAAIWSIISGAPFDGNWRALAQKCSPPITVWEVKRAIQLLETLKLIKKKDDGKYYTTSLNLTSGQKWHAHAVETHQREMIRLAGESIDRFGKNERDISTVTITIDEKALPAIQEHVRQFRLSLIKMVNNLGGSERVYQLNIQLFPLSNSAEEKV